MNERKRPLCEICLREQKHTVATHVFAVRTTRYYFVCKKHYDFLRFTGGVTEEEYYKDKTEEE